jgi:hypothetical protein
VPHHHSPEHFNYQIKYGNSFRFASDAVHLGRGENSCTGERQTFLPVGAERYAGFTGCLQHGQYVSSLNKYTRHALHGIPRSIRRDPFLGAGLTTVIVLSDAPFGP